jgi:hypothetical protein
MSDLSDLSHSSTLLFQVDFPAVTICSQGINEDLLYAGLFQQFFLLLTARNISIPMTPLKAVDLIRRVGFQETASASDEELFTWLYEQAAVSSLYEEFLNTRLSVQLNLCL